MLRLAFLMALIGSLWFSVHGPAAWSGERMSGQALAQEQQSFATIKNKSGLGFDEIKFGTADLPESSLKSYGALADGEALVIELDATSDSCNYMITVYKDGERVLHKSAGFCSHSQAEIHADESGALYIDMK